MAAKVTRTCVSIVYSVKVYNEDSDTVSTKEVAISEDVKPEKGIAGKLNANETPIKYKAIKRVEELRVMSSDTYIEHSTVESRKETPIE